MGIPWHYVMVLWSTQTTSGFGVLDCISNCPTLADDIMCIAIVILDTADSRESPYCAKLYNEDHDICEEATFMRECRNTCANHTLTCFSCPSVSHPSKCTNRVKCQAKEMCVVTQAFNSNFETIYRLGCIPEEECKLFMHDGDLRRSTTLLGDCCSHSKCNHYRPESLKEKLECYNCNDTDHPLRCRTTTECSPGQLCVVTRAINANFDLTYRQGCMDRHTCDGFVHDGIPHARSTVPLRGDCCETDKCNRYDTPHKSECRDHHEHACKNLAKKEPSACNDRDMKRYCPKTCEQCVNCFQCTSEHESLENCTSTIRCDITSRKSCTIRKTIRHGVQGFARSCMNDKYCHRDDSYCCKGEKCNDNYPKTTTSQPTTTIKPTTTPTVDSTTNKPTTKVASTTSKPTTTVASTRNKPTTTVASTTNKPTTTVASTTNKPTTTSKPSTTAIPTTTRKQTTSKPTTTKPTTTNYPTTTTAIPTTRKPTTEDPTTQKSTSRPWFTVPVATPSPTKIWFTIPPATTAQPWFTIPTNAPKSTSTHVWITVPFK